MIVYRIQGSSGESWATQWEATVETARKTARDLQAAGFQSVHVDKIDVGTGREALVAALNHAHVNRINWNGEEVKP